MVAVTDPVTGVTTVDELVVTAKRNPPALPTTLQQASFRGVPFGVLTADGVFGRRNAPHEYPYRDKPWIEDLGKKTRRINIVGFLVTDSLVYGGGPVLEQRAAFVAAAETEGSGTLVHPTLGALTVSMDLLTVSEKWDEQHYFELQISVIESGELVFPSTSTSTTDATGSAADGADAAASSDFATAIGPQLATGGAAIDSLGAEVAGWGQAISGLGQDATGLFNLGARLVGPYGRYFNGGLAGFGNTLGATLPLATTIADLIQQGAAGRAAITAAVVAETTIAGNIGLIGSQPTDLGAAAQGTTAALAANAADPADVLRLLTDLAGFSTGATSDIAGAVGDLHRRAAVTSLARASAAYQPSSADDAATIRDQVAGAIDNEILIAGDQGEDATFTALRALRTAVVRDLQARGAGLAPLTVINTVDTQPALTLANRLYRDASRADQLVTFADPIHPLFMPTSFEALAA